MAYFNTGRTNTNKNNSSEPVKSEFFIKIGKEHLNSNNDKIELITLPQPLFLDSMKKNEIYGTGDFQEALCAGNDLLDQILKLAQNDLQPGEEAELDLKVIVCRRKTSQTSEHETVDFGLSLKKR